MTDLEVLKVKRAAQIDRVREAEKVVDELRRELLRIDMHIAQATRAASADHSITPRPAGVAPGSVRRP